MIDNFINLCWSEMRAPKAHFINKVTVMPVTPDFEDSITANSISGIIANKALDGLDTSIEDYVLRYDIYLISRQMNEFNAFSASVALSDVENPFCQSACFIRNILGDDSVAFNTLFRLASCFYELTEDNVVAENIQADLLVSLYDFTAISCSREQYLGSDDKYVSSLMWAYIQFHSILSQVTSEASKYAGQDEEFDGLVKEFSEQGKYYALNMFEIISGTSYPEAINIDGLKDAASHIRKILKPSGYHCSKNKALNLISEVRGYKNGWAQLKGNLDIDKGEKLQLTVPDMERVEGLEVAINAIYSPLADLFLKINIDTIDNTIVDNIVLLRTALTRRPVFADFKRETLNDLFHASSELLSLIVDIYHSSRSLVGTKDLGAIVSLCSLICQRNSVFARAL